MGNSAQDVPDVGAIGIAHELESYSYEEYVEDTDESAFRNDVERIVRRIDRLISETKSRLS